MKAVIPARARATIAAAALLGAVACGGSPSSGAPVNPVKSYGSQVSDGPSSGVVSSVETAAPTQAAPSSNPPPAESAASSDALMAWCSGNGYSDYQAV